MNPNESPVDFFQGLLIALFILCVVSIAGAQIYKVGQRHPDPAKFVTYSAAVDLANERQTVGYDKGYSTCQEAF